MTFAFYRNFRWLSCFFLLLGCSNDVKFAVPPSSQEFNQSVAYNNKVDFLFVVDNSKSMNKVQENLLSSLMPLTTTLNQLKLDYHVASTSTTMASWFPMSGKIFGEPKFITSSTPDFQNRLTEKIMLGDSGSTVEKGLDAIKSILSFPFQNDDGQTFLRSDALLVIVYLTNEDDKSDKIDTGNSNNQTKHYSDFLDSVRPLWSNGQRSWIFNFIGITSQNDACTTGDLTDYKEPGIRLMEMAKKSNGRIETICQIKLDLAISNIKARLVQFLTDYKLNKIPVVDSIRVYVNQILIPMHPTSGWSYLPDLNVIRFNGDSVPKADDDIRVDFTPDGPN